MYWWWEKYYAYPLGDPRGTQAFLEAASPASLVARLRGKLLLVHGDLDDVHPANTLWLVNAFIDANKPVDLLIVPDAGHTFPPHVIVRTEWDYITRNLLGVDPPHDYRMSDAP